MVKIPDAANRGRGASMSSPLSFPRIIRNVVYKEPAANSQFVRNREVENTFAIVDLSTFACNRRDATLVVTDPFSELDVNMLVECAS